MRRLTLSVAILLLDVGAALSRECTSGDQAVVNGEIAATYANDDGYGIDLREISVKSPGGEFTVCSLTGVDVDTPPDSDCVPGSSISAVGMLFFATPPARLSADKLTCAGKGAATNGGGDDLLNNPSPLRATPDDREWILEGAKIFKGMLQDERLLKIYCQFIKAKADTKSLFPDDVELRNITNLQLQLGEPFNRVIGGMDADPKIAATKDYVEYRDSYNALVASCPAAKGQMGFTISEKFNGYIRTPSGRFDLTYDPAEWDRVEDLAQKSYYQGGETDEQPSELGLDFMRRSRTKRGQDITVRIDGLPSNRLIEMQDSYWQNKYGTPGRLTNVGTRKVLIVEDDDGMGFTKIYFDGPVYGILVSTRGPKAARTLALPLMNKLIEGIRMK